MFITMPACVIEHAFLVEVALFLELATKVVVNSCHIVSLITYGTNIVSIPPRNCLCLMQVHWLISRHKPVPFYMLTTLKSEPELLEVHKM